MRTQLFFVSFPYAAVALLVAGLLVRYGLLRNRIESVAPQMSEVRNLFGGRLWQFSLVLLALGHLGGLLLPRQVQLWDSSPFRLYLLEGLGFVIGLYVLFGWGILLWKHLAQNSVSRIAEVADTIFLSLFSVGIVSGLLVAVLHRWSSSWAVVTLTPYVISLLHGKPAVTLVSGLPFFVQLHVISAFASLVIFPFTRVAPFLIVPVHHVASFVARPVSALSRSIWEALLGLGRRYNPAPLLWPEEEE